MPTFECTRCNEMTYSASAGAIAACPRCGSERQRVIEGGFDEARRSLRPLGESDHATLVYDDAAAIAPFCARFLTDGVKAGERVIAGVEDHLREAICALLGPDAELTVEWQDPRSLYVDFDAARVAATYEALIGSEERTTRILAGLDSESAQSVDREQWDQYETLAHEIATDHGATVVCLYDTGVLPPDLLDVGACRHGLTVEHGAARRNERFEYQPV